MNEVTFVLVGGPACGTEIPASSYPEGGMPAVMIHDVNTGKCWMWGYSPTGRFIGLERMELRCSHLRVFDSPEELNRYQSSVIAAIEHENRPDWEAGDGPDWMEGGSEPVEV